VIGLLLRVVISLAVVLGIVWFVARGSRRFGGTSRLVRVAGRHSLSRTASVAVVQVADRMLVLGVSEAGVRLLTELDPEQVAQREQAQHEPAQLEPAQLEPAQLEPAQLEPAQLEPARQGAGSGALAGSMLSPDTWRQAWAAATGRQHATPAMTGPGSAATATDE
jgi:flagellar protein FliO/FliZ